MWSSRAWLPVPAAAVIAAPIALFILSVDFSPTPALATHTGDADYVLLDMDTAGNTATSVGPVQTCARINQNGVQDADEDSIDRVATDVVTGPAGIPLVPNLLGSVPPLYGLLAFQADLEYPAGVITAWSEEVDFLIAVNPESSIIDISQSVPDTDGKLVVGAADIGDPIGESGPGTLARVTLGTNSGAPAGIYPIAMTGFHIDGNGDAHVPDNQIDVDADGSSDIALPVSQVAIDVPCPAGVDVQITAASVVSLPAPAVSGVPFSIEVNGTVHNAGPAHTVDARVYFRLDSPDCGSQVASADLSLPQSSSVSVSYTFELTCHGVYWRSVAANVIAVPSGSAFLESAPTNNAASAGPFAFFVASDDDGVDDSVDACPFTQPSQPVDADGCADSQVDPDGDGICSPDAASGGPSACTGIDNCPNVPNPGQEDTDGDGIADVCESQPPIAVGGLMGLLDSDREEPRAPGGSTGTHPAVAFVVAALGAVAVAGVMRLSRRRTPAD